MIVTLSEMKAELGLTDTTDDAALTLWMAALDGRFDSFLNRTLARSAAAEEIFDGGGKMLLLARFPVESVASINVDGAALWAADTLLDADAYRLNKTRGRIYYGTSGDIAWPAGRQNIRVIYAGGYVGAGELPAAGQTAMPEAIRRAYLMQCGFEWRNRSHLGQASVSAQGAGINLAPAKLLPEVETILEEFKRY